MRVFQAIGLLLFFAMLLVLASCDGDLERKQQVAERNAKFWNACAAMGRERIVNEWQDGKLICYMQDRKPGQHQTPAVVASKEDL